MLEEPTAAAVAYGLHQSPHVHHVLVYDFGGGTLDVSILYMSEGAATVIGTAGDDYLGGECGIRVLSSSMGLGATPCLCCRGRGGL